MVFGTDSIVTEPERSNIREPSALETWASEKAMEASDRKLSQPA